MSICQFCGNDTLMIPIGSSRVRSVRYCHGQSWNCHDTVIDCHDTLHDAVMHAVIMVFNEFYQHPHRLKTGFISRVSS